MLRKIRLLPVVALVCVLAILPTLSYAQDTPSLDVPLTAFTTGVIGEDGSIFYSVVLASGPDALTDVSIAATLPENATFQAVTWTPESAVVVGEADGVVTWTLAELPADTVIGPFSVQVTFAPDDTAIPVNIPAVVTAGETGENEVIVEALEGILEAAETSGVLELDVTGTNGALVEVGETNIFVYAPADAYDQPVTLTFNRLPIEPGVSVPEGDDFADYWWCSSIAVTVEPAEAQALLPLTIFAPLRRTLTPGMALAEFVQQGDGEWEVTVPEAAYTLDEMFARPNRQDSGYSGPKVATNGNHLVFYMTPRRSPSGQITDGTSNTIMFGEGVQNQDRQRGTTGIIAILIGVRYVEQENLNVDLSGLGPSIVSPRDVNTGGH